MRTLKGFGVVGLVLVLAGVVGASSSSVPQPLVVVQGYSDVIRFQVQGTEVEELRLEVFNLAGQRLFDSGYQPGEILDWQRLDSQGRRLAGGVYLYRVTVQDRFGTSRQRIGKLVLLPGQSGLSSAPPLNGSATVGRLAERERGVRALAFDAANFFLSGILGVGTDAPATSGPSIHIKQSDPNVSPQIRLEVAGANPQHFPNLRFFNGSTAVGQLIADAAVGRFVFDYCAACGGDFTVRKAVDSADPADVVLFGSNSGNIGIGTSSPTARTHINNTANQPALRIDSSDGTNAIEVYNTGVGGSSIDPVFRVERTTGNVYADGSYNCGLTTGSCFNAGQGADVAERIDASEPLEPGDVVEIDPDQPGKFRKAREAMSRRVAGVISTAPAITMGNDFDPEAKVWEDQRPLLALAGRVPVKAIAKFGPIEVGDLLVSSPIPGYAMKCPEAAQCIGAIIGKALEPLQEGVGMITAQVMLR